MCGIVGATAQRDVAPILLEGLKRLEYRGYDSAGLAVISAENSLRHHRVAGKVHELAEALKELNYSGGVGIAHTRWATHGKPTVQNAHPHVCDDKVVIVHNGIIENHEALRTEQISNGYSFNSDTDSEVIANQVHSHLKEKECLITAVSESIRVLQGAYALAVVSVAQPDRIVVARKGSPIVIGLGVRENFVASDIYALLPVTQRFVFLEEGDIAEVTRDAVDIYDSDGRRVTRPETLSNLSSEAADKGGYKHFMLKEILEQSSAVAETLEGRIESGSILEAGFEKKILESIKDIEAVTVIACGTSYHAALIMKYWVEQIIGIPCRVEVASEYRYKKPIVGKNELFVAVSQSGETADTLAALRYAKEFSYVASLAICNVAQSSIVRAADCAILTRAGPEIGVASTKAFTTQLVVMLMLVVLIAKRSKKSQVVEREVVKELESTPAMINKVLALNDEISHVAANFSAMSDCLYLGRGIMYPIALEGALKLKEISYIHAEAYPGGELKHGPLALVDDKMPVIAIVANDDLKQKIESNLEEVKARGGNVYRFGEDLATVAGESQRTISIPSGSLYTSPIIYNIALQILAYHVAVLKGSDIDQPRNLAKSVTVE